MAGTGAPSVDDFLVEEYYDTGRVDITGAIDPLSLQASAMRKAAFKAALGAAISASTTLMFNHDVQVTVVWYVEEAKRYQTHLVADIDNVLKPILDAMTGPDGVLIDDNQVQSIQVSWMTPARRAVAFEATVQAVHPEDRIRREDLAFVEFAPNRCYILPGGLGHAHRASFVGEFRRQLRDYDRRVDRGILPEVAAMSLPLARPFPRARLSRFQVISEAQF